MLPFVVFIPPALTAFSQACSLFLFNYHSPLHLTFEHSATHCPTPSPAAIFRVQLLRSTRIRSPYTIILMQMTHGKSYTNQESSNQSFQELTSGRRCRRCLNRPNFLQKSPKLPLLPISPPTPRVPILHAGSTPQPSIPTSTATPPVITRLRLILVGVTLDGRHGHKQQ